MESGAQKTPFNTVLLRRPLEPGVYQSLENSWVVATVRTDPDFAVESRVPFAASLGFIASPNTRNFDISPDDQRLLVLRIEGGVDDELILVENWAEELRERVGN